MTEPAVRPTATGASTRVLLVVPDTDDSPENDRVVDLHRSLADSGLHVRTVALGPGRSGGLDAVLPVLAPSARSLAAVLQLRRETRWADVVACSGPLVARVQAVGTRSGSVPVVVMPRADAPSRGGGFLMPTGATVLHRWPDTPGWCELLGDLHRCNEAMTDGDGT